MKLGKIVLFAVVVLALYITFNVKANYEYSRTIGSYWDLSVKASTLTMKADYLNKFVAAVDSAHLSGHNALFFPTPDNDVAQNIATLKNLQHRMEEIRGMDVTSFAYQQAISQITAQEQDEAQGMLSVISSSWFLVHHPLFWDWINILIYVLLVGFVFLTGLVILINS